MNQGGKKLLEHLFLLEVLVEKVMLKDKKCSKGCTCKHAVSHNKELPIRIRVKFINFPCFEISQEDFGTETLKLTDPGSKGNFKGGKSCMFPMAPLDLVRAIKAHPLVFTVFQRTWETSPAQILGVGRTRLASGMCDCIRRATECKEELPLSATQTGTIPIITTEGKDAGRIKIFIRLTCFGQSIVTQFQLVGPDDYYLFKNSRADTAFQCKKCIDRSEITRPEFEDVVPVPPVVCDSDENFFEFAKGFKYELSPKEVAASCECDVYKQRVREIVPTVPSFIKGEEESEEEVEEEGEEVPALAWLPELKLTNPPIRYDTTGALSPAFEGREVTSMCHPSVRYDTTGALSPAFQDMLARQWPFNPPVRYDTTSALSPAFEGVPPPRPLALQHPPTRYDTTSALSAAHIHPPVRYDNTGALSAAFMGPLPEKAPELEINLKVTLVEPEIPEEEPEPQKPQPLKRRLPTKKSEMKAQKSRENRDRPEPTTHPEEPRVDTHAPVDVYNQAVDIDGILGLGQQQEKGQKAKKKKMRESFDWDLPDHYPTVRRGHKHCLDPFNYVPKRMGWLWNVSNPGFKYRPGWRPGAVTRTVNRIINSHNQAAGIKHQTDVKVKRRQRSGHSVVQKSHVSHELQPPTLVISRRRGQYYITMKPLIDPHKKGRKGDGDGEEGQPEVKEEKGEEVKPFKVCIPGKKPESDSSKKSDSKSESSSNLDIEFLAPGAFEPRWLDRSLKNKGTQYWVHEPKVPKPPKSPKPTKPTKPTTAAKPTDAAQPSKADKRASESPLDVPGGGKSKKKPVTKTPMEDKEVQVSPQDLFPPKPKRLITRTQRKVVKSEFQKARAKTGAIEQDLASAQK